METDILVFYKGIRHGLRLVLTSVAFIKYTIIVFLSRTHCLSYFLTSAQCLIFVKMHFDILTSVFITDSMTWMIIQSFLLLHVCILSKINVRALGIQFCLPLLCGMISSSWQ